MITIIQQTHRKLTVAHPEHIEVRDFNGAAIVASYVGYCHGCEPMLFDVYGDRDLYIEISTPTDEELPQRASNNRIC